MSGVFKKLRWLQIAVGVIFVFAGVGKLLLPVLIPILKPGAPDFAAVLDAVHVPLPKLTAVAICLLEIVGGLALIGKRLVLPASVLLAGNMGGALVSVSVPAHLGRPVQLGGLTIGNEWWRLPLELGLVVSLSIIAVLELQRLRAMRDSTRQS